MNFKFMLTIFSIFWMIFSLRAEEMQENKTLTLPSAGISELKIECGAGSLFIEGSTDLKEIEVKAIIKISNINKNEINTFIKDNIILKLEKEGSTAVLQSDIDSPNWFSALFNNPDASIDLTVRVPATVSLDIEDGSGDVAIIRVNNNVLLDDGSGSIKIRDITGKVEVQDGSGSAILENIKGNLYIEDGSGELYIKNINGSVKVDDGSGQMSLYQINGNVKVEDGSGDIYIDGVTQNVEIIEAGSGNLSIQNVKGTVKK